MVELGKEKQTLDKFHEGTKELRGVLDTITIPNQRKWRFNLTEIQETVNKIKNLTEYNLRKFYDKLKEKMQEYFTEFNKVVHESLSLKKNMQSLINYVILTKIYLLFKNNCVLYF